MTTQAATVAIEATGNAQRGGLLSVRALSTSAISSMVLRMIGPVSSFLLALLLARVLGASGSGAFFVALTLATAFAIVAKFGLETALQRFIGGAHGRGDTAAVRGIARQAIVITVLFSVLVSSLMFFGSELLAGSLLGDAVWMELVAIMGLMIVPFSLLGILAAIMKAIGLPARGGFFEAASWSLVSLVLVGALMLITDLSVESVAAAYLLAASIALVFAYMVLRKQVSQRGVASYMPPRTLLGSCSSFTVVELVNYALLWTPFLLLPALASTQEAGLYNVSHRLAAQIGLLMLVFSSITSPRFAAYFQQEQHDALSALAGRTTRMLIIFGMPPALVLLVWSEEILALFGSEFVDAAIGLQILVLGQLFNLATGPVGYLLAMTGNDRVLRYILATTLAIVVLLAMLLIPSFGATGAAAAVALGMVFNNLVSCHLVSRRLGLPFLLAFSR